MQTTSSTIHNRSLMPDILLCRLAVFASIILLLFSFGCAKNRVTYSSSAHSYQHPFDPTSARNSLNAFYNNWKGVPHRTGGMSQSAIDCSGLTVRAYKDIFDVKLPRTTEEQSRYGKNISKNSLLPGDLVFFKTGLFQRHVGIFLEKNSFIHASASKGVMISRLNEPYWQGTYWKATRINNYKQTAAN